MTTYPFLETVPIGMTASEVYVVEKNSKQTWLIPGILFCVCGTVFLLCIITIFLSARKDYDFAIDQHTQWSLVGDTYRIPTNVRPVIYHLYLKVYLPYRQCVNFYEKNFTFNADLLLKLLCERTTNIIVLNIKELAFNISDVLLLDENDEILSILDVQPLFQKAGRTFNYFIKFIIEQPLITGHYYTLQIKYRGILGNYKQGGLYSSSYRINNETRYVVVLINTYTYKFYSKYLAVTQNQINDASRILPCFDEPEMKAEFNITVRHPRGTKAISNGAIKSIKHFAVRICSNWTETNFDVTPKMSTYLLALAISDFEQNYRYCDNHVQVCMSFYSSLLS
uniref:Peptidase_M1_N domain-containing protein n=1 Tax=Syphacia muris TaxID=451379 RepID=A0A0N5ATR9_9BILA